jgi:oligopeptide transport system permease protein
MADARRPVVVVAAIPVVVVVSMAAFPGLWTDVDPRACDLAASGRAPSAAHVFGTNALGCDYYAMIVHGARSPVLVGVCTTLAVIVIGALLGTVAGYRGGWLDAVISRITEVFASVPALLGALVFLTLLRTHSTGAIVLALGLLGWPPVARVARGCAIVTRQADFVRAARGLGASGPRIALRHVLPAATTPVLAIGTASLGGFIAAEATLSYLGVGLRPPAVSWGIMISQGQQAALSGQPHLLLFPGGFLVVTVLALVLIGDAVAETGDSRRRTTRPSAAPFPGRTPSWRTGRRASKR